jgi:transposase-like protein
MSRLCIDVGKELIDRKQQGYLIAQMKGSVNRINDTSYTVSSQSGNGTYMISSSALGWKCSCADHLYRGVKCKHIYAVEISFAIRREVEIRRIEPVNTQCCVLCKSLDIVKDGLRHNKYGDLQKYSCRGCNHYFTINLGFEKMHATPQIITTAIQLYFTGESFRNVQKFLQLQGVKMSHVAVYKWIKKYVTLMQTYLEKIQPQVGDAWRTDELFVKIKGDMKYLYAIMDDETRFWIAQQVADTKYVADITPMFNNAKELAGKRPNVLISDGAPNFHQAFNKAFYTNTSPRSRHIKHIRFKGDHNNNKIERMNGEIRDREKVMRGLKVANTSVLPGYQIYHNYFRPHMALADKTPAEKCGIIIEGENKWKTVIENASKKC